MTPKRTGEFTGAPSAPPQRDSSEAAKVLSQLKTVAHAESALVLEPRNSRRVESWQGVKVKNKEDLKEKSVSCTDNGSPECISNMALCQNAFPSCSTIKEDIVR